MKNGKQLLAVRPRLWITGSSKLADRLGVTRNHMSMILHGTRRPGRELAARMRRLGVKWPIKELANGEAAIHD